MKLVIKYAVSLISLGLIISCQSTSPKWKSASNIGLTYGLDNQKRSIQFERNSKRIEGRILLSDQLLVKNEVVTESDYQGLLKELELLEKETLESIPELCRNPFQLSFTGPQGERELRGCRETLKSKKLGKIIKQAEYLILSSSSD